MQKEYKIWVLVAEAYGFKEHQQMNIHVIIQVKKYNSST